MTRSIFLLLSTVLLPAAAVAQSNVTVYGSIDAGLRYQTNVDAQGNSLLTAGSGTSYSNRLGFRGVEDLGNGLSARFQLESGFSSKTGALDNTSNMLFNRTASVGLGGKWGYVDVGRLYTIGFRTEKFLDPFDHSYTGIVPLSSGAGTSLPAAAKEAGLGASSSSGTRFNNNVQYTGSFDAVTLRAEVASGEVAGDTGKGSARAVGAMYAGSRWLAAGAYTRKETASGFANRAFIVGGGVKFAGITIKAGLSRERQESAAAGMYRHATRFAGIGTGVTPVVDITAAVYRSSYDGAGNSGTRTLYMIGATYTLSKRSRLYAEYDVNRYDGALLPASGQARQRGMSAGLRHLF
jgi:predicted porin